MQIRHWQLIEPIDAVVFDCDGTLSAIEGINELAAMRGVAAIVSALTEKAMSETGLNPELYRERLQIVQPSQADLIRLAALYCASAVPQAAAVINVLTQLKKPVYIASAGLLAAILPFAAQLGVPAENVFAVDANFDQQGQYVDFDQQSPLVKNNGKELVLMRLKKQHPRLLLIGDGQNDVAAAHVVSRFIGFGGVYYRESIKQVSDYYITVKSLAPLLALALTATEVAQLSGDSQKLYQLGLSYSF